MEVLDSLMEELKGGIIEALELEDLTPEEIDNDEQLVGGDLGIDSIDVLEMVMMIEENYGVKINNQKIGREVFKSIRTLAEYINTNR